jgi:hypothetical protein
MAPQGPSVKAKPSDLDPLALLEAGDPAEWAEQAAESWDFAESVWRDDLTEGVKVQGERQGNPIVDPEEIPGPLPGIPSASVQFAKLTAANLVPPSGLGLGSTYARSLEPSATIGAPVIAQTILAADQARKSRHAPYVTPDTYFVCARGVDRLSSAFCAGRGRGWARSRRGSP